MNAEEFKQKVLPVNQKLLRLSFRFLGNIQEAEDAVQEVYIKLWGMRQKLVEINNVEAFATTVTKNHCLDRLKSRHTVSLEDHLPNLTSRESVHENPHQISENQDSVSYVKLIIDNLPEQQKSMIVMRDIEQYSFEEIQEITGLDMNYIRVNLSRARKQVRQELTKVHEYGTERDKKTTGEIL
ncbi:MAG TPA: RNA polymerase sigma factor [Bacteroidales bacterium]